MINISQHLIILALLSLCISCSKSSTSVVKSTSEAFKDKLSTLNNADVKNVDLNKLSKWIIAGEFSSKEVFYWLKNRKLSPTELSDLKNGLFLNSEDIDACFFYLGMHDPEQALIFYYKNIMGVSIQVVNRLVIPSQQTVWVDQYLKSIIEGMKKNQSDYLEKWDNAMSQKHVLDF